MNFQYTKRMGYESNYSWLHATYQFSWDSFGQVALAHASQAALESFQARDMDFSGWVNKRNFGNWRRLMQERYPHIPQPF